MIRPRIAKKRFELPILPEQEAIEFIDAFRKKIAVLPYHGVGEKITVSIGLVCGDENCYLTSHEIEAKVSKAKAFAKENGKNCIATYRSGARLLEDNDLYIYQPKQKDQ